ncbi:putative signal transducing protein [Lacipirellula sp.]|uniref:putative signal transducing protein n=1 Tax=Lacipirellula sp. TaxID=2691419 RepID=UPI003D1299EE
MIHTSAPNPVTVASFGGVTEAEIAQQCLAAAGIESYLVDAAMVGTMWHLGVAMGGVKLQVADVDAVEATELLTEARAGRLEFEFDESGVAEESEAEPEQELDVSSEREKLANRAYKVVFLSILLEPLLLYGAWLLLQVAVSSEPLRQPYRRRAYIAAFFTASILGTLAFFVAYTFN